MDAASLYNKYCCRCGSLDYFEKPKSHERICICLKAIADGDIPTKIFHNDFKVPNNCVYRLETLMENELK